MSAVPCCWVVYRDTRAPMPSQQRQVTSCQCGACRNARLLKEATIRHDVRLHPATAERLAVLQWKPAPETAP